MKSKKLTSKSGLTIPKDLRSEAGFLPSMAVDLVPVDGGILIKAHLPTCRFCGSVEGIVSHCDTDICAMCIEILSKEAAVYDGKSD